MTQRFYWLVLPLLLFGCRTQKFDDGAGRSTTVRKSFSGVPVANLRGECVADYRPDIDYFPEKATLEFARVFSVEYHKNYKVVRLAVERRPEGESGASDTLVLVQCGTPAPKLEGDLANATAISIPVMSIACNDNCDIAAISQLGYENRLTAIGGGHLYNASVRQRWDAKKLATIGYAWHGLPNSEVLLASPPDVLFMRRATLEQGISLARSRRLGIRAAPTLARHEKHYLGFAEWVKYFALFLNAEKTAQSSFSEVAQRCLSISQRARSTATKPLAFWAGYSSGGTWSAARSPLDFRSRFLEDAGAVNPLFDAKALPTGEVPNEALLNLAAEADFWISESVTTKGWPAPRILNRFKSYRENHVYHHEKRTIFELDAYDWYETGAMRPDLVLEDLVSLFHPELAPGHSLMFFDRVRKEATN
jgi:iron complex transport system substrate-binding protein